MALIDSLKSLK